MTTKGKTPKIPPPRSQKEQSERFLAAVRELEDAGELSPTEAAERFGQAIERLVPAKPVGPDGPRKT